MIIGRILILLPLLLLVDCRKSDVPKSAVGISHDSSTIVTTKSDSLSLIHTRDSLHRIQDSILDERAADSIEIHGKKIAGYRFRIRGNFGGVDHEVTLTEHFYSKRDKKESNKFYDGLNGDDQAYGLLVKLTTRKDPESYLESNDPQVPRFLLPEISTGQLLGLSMLRNEGDLDGDGSDEISFVIDWADWSSVNSCYIASLINGRWCVLDSFEIRDWQLPGLPDVQPSFGMFGVDGLVQAPDSKASRQAEHDLLAFPGFIKKISDGKIKVHTFNEHVEPIWKVVDLKRISDRIRSQSGLGK